MNSENSERKTSNTSFQLQLWRRGVGPWVSEFEGNTPSAECVDGEAEMCIDTGNCVKNYQGLWVRKKKKLKTRQSSVTGSKSSRHKYDPSNDNKINGDPHRTVFVARLDYSTTEETVSEVFSKFGSIKQLCLVMDSKTGRSRGYAFVEFIEASDSKRVLKETRDKRLLVDGKEVLVDRVQAGVVPSWLPRRLGGGLGQRQKGTQRFTWKLAHFEMHRKQQLWLDHNRRSTNSFS